MNARSKFTPLISAWWQPITEDITDCRGKVRTIKSYYGSNKGRKYPYASKRQRNRVYRAD